MIHELNIQKGDTDQFYGIDVTPTESLEEAITEAQYDGESDGDKPHYVVGYWTDGGCYTGGMYHATDNKYKHTI